MDSGLLIWVLGAMVTVTVAAVGFLAARLWSVATEMATKADREDLEEKVRTLRIVVDDKVGVLLMDHIEERVTRNETLLESLRNEARRVEQAIREDARKDRELMMAEARKDREIVSAKVDALRNETQALFTELRRTHG